MVALVHATRQILSEQQLANGIQFALANMAQSLAAKLKAMNLASVMVIADEIDENLYLASRNLVNVLVVEPRYADPVSLVHYRKVVVTKAAMDKLKEMFA